jgi:diacylglycerol kinase
MKKQQTTATMSLTFEQFNTFVEQMSAHISKHDKKGEVKEAKNLRRYLAHVIKTTHVIYDE